MNNTLINKIYVVFHGIGVRALMVSVMVLTMLIPCFSQRRNDQLLNRPYADMKRWHLGFSIGTHVEDLKFTHNGYVTEEGEQWYAEIPSYSPGFCVNVLADLRLHKNFNLRFSPGMYFGNKVVKMRESVSGITKSQDVKSAYVVIPVDLKISGARYLNSRPYVTTGVMGTFDVGKRRSEALWLNSGDVYLTLGIGCDFYMPFFKFNPEIKFCFGLSDVLRHDRPDLVDDLETFKMTQSLSKVKSNMIVVTFYFE
jgi:hypothetical protein